MGLGLLKRRRAAERPPEDRPPVEQDTYSLMVTSSPRLVAMAVHDKHWLWSTHIRADSTFAIDNPTFSPSSDVSTPFKVPERITCETDQPPTPPDAAAQPLLAPAERSLAAPPQSRAHRLRAALLRALAACAPRRKHAPDTSDAALRALPAGTLVRCVVHPVDRTPSAAASACSDACSDAANDADDEADSCDLRGPGTGQSFGVHTAESSTDHLPPTPVPPLPLKFPKEWLTTGTAAVRAIPGFASMPSARGREGAMVLAIEAALNRAYQDKDILAGCFMLLGPGQRWRDATGIVQVASHIAHDQIVLVKCYFDTEDFERELTLRDDPDIASTLVPPMLVYARHDTEAVSSCDTTLSPFMVFEQAETLCQWAARTTFQQPNAGLFLARRSGIASGAYTGLPDSVACGCVRPRSLPSPRRLRSPRRPMQSLRDWIKRAAPSEVQIMATLLCVATSIQLLHERGVAHGNIHLSSVYCGLDTPLWLLLDTGFSAEIGEDVPTEHPSLRHATPEATLASAGAPLPPSSGAEDVWALGALSFQLLTQEEIFQPADDPVAMREQLEGVMPFPWEQPGVHGELLGRLRLLRPTVLSCLDRDPRNRPRIGEIVGVWQMMFDSVSEGQCMEAVLERLP